MNHVSNLVDAVRAGKIDLRTAATQSITVSCGFPILLTGRKIGFVLAGLAAKFTPSLNRAFVRLTFLGSIVVGLLAALVSDHGLAIEALLGLALVAGTAGYSMRLRGFSLRQYTDRTAAAMQRAREVGAPTRLALPIARYITYVSASTAMRTTMMIM